MTQAYSHIVWPKDFDEEKKSAFLAMIDHRLKEQFDIQVVYHPSCGCDLERLYMLDRYPMSEKIQTICRQCNKGSLDEISDPITFYNPIEKKDLSLEDFRKYVITEPSKQAPFLKAYQFEANLQFLEKACDEADNPG